MCLNRNCRLVCSLYLVGRLPVRWLQVLALLTHSPGLLQAPQFSTTIALPAVQYALDRFAPGITSGEAVFFVDASTTISESHIRSSADYWRGRPLSMA